MTASWNGAWATSQQIGPSNNKSSSKSCNYPSDTSGCINFTPSPGLSPSITPNSGGVQICADYVELSNLLFNSSTYVDTYNDTVSRATWWVGKGDSTCQPSGAPPHDIFINNVVSNGPAGIGGGASNVYVLGGSIGVRSTAGEGATFWIVLPLKIASGSMEMRGRLVLT